MGTTDKFILEYIQAVALNNIEKLTSDCKTISTKPPPFVI